MKSSSVEFGAKIHVARKGKCSTVRDLRVRTFEKLVGCPAELTNEAMQGGNRRQNRRNHPKKPEDPAFRRGMCVSGIGMVIEEISRESSLLGSFHVISKSMSVSVVIGTCCTSIVSSMATSWMSSPRCHPKFQEARFKKPVPQGELKRLPSESLGAMRSPAETCGARNALTF